MGTIGTPAAWALACGVALSGISGCGDDGHKGTVSQGPASGSVANPTSKTNSRVTVDSGSPLAAAAVAKRLRKRLSAYQVPGESVTLRGSKVTADVPPTQLAKIKQQLGQHQLDIHVGESKNDWLSDAKAEPAAAPFQSLVERRAAAGGVHASHYLTAPADKRAALHSYLKKKLGRRGLLGPLFGEGTAPTGYRSYQVQAGRSIRGEQVETIRAVAEDDEIALLLQLTPVSGAGARLLRNNGAWFVLQVDHEVVATVVPNGPAKNSPPDGTTQSNELRFVLARRGTVADTLRTAEATAKRLNGIAFSHQVRLKN